MLSLSVLMALQGWLAVCRHPHPSPECPPSPKKEAWAGVGASGMDEPLPPEHAARLLAPESASAPDPPEVCLPAA